MKVFFLLLFNNVYIFSLKKETMCIYLYIMPAHKLTSGTC